MECAPSRWCARPLTRSATYSTSCSPTPNATCPGPPRGRRRGRDVVRDWQPLFARLQDTIDWALDIAAKLARDYDEEIEAIERVRVYVHAWLGGRHVDVDMNDILTTLGILFAAVDIG